MRNGFVVHSEDGLDEISSLAVTHAAALSPDGIRELVIDPKELLNDASLCEGTLAGGDKTENARILMDILSGRDHTAKRGAVILNAAAIICAAGLGDSIKSCIPLAENSIDSCAALDKLKRISA